MQARRASALAALLRQAAAAAETALPPGCQFPLPHHLLHQHLQTLFSAPPNTPPPAPAQWPALGAAPPAAASNSAAAAALCRRFHAARAAADAAGASPGPGADLELVALDGSEEDKDAEGGSALRLHPSERAALFASTEMAAVVDYLQRELRLPVVRVQQLVARLAYVSFTERGQMFTREEPGALDLDGSVRPVLEFLKALPGVALARAVSNCPHLLTTPPSLRVRFPTNAAWLTRELALGPGDLGKLVNTNAYVLRRPLEATTRPALDLLRGLGFSGEEVRSVVLRQPKILAYRRDRLEHGLGSLRHAGMAEAQVKAAVWKLPSVVFIAGSRVGSLAAWLRAQGVPADEVPAVLARFPTLLSFSIPNNLEPTLAFLRGSEVGLTPPGVARLLRSAPDTLGRRVGRLRGNVAGMRRAGMAQSQVESMVNASPGTLRYDLSAAPYAHKLRFLREQLRMDPGPALTTNPNFLTYGLERIACRGAFLQRLQRPTRALTAWLAASDCKFVALHARSTPEEWRAFQAAWRASDEGRQWVGGAA